MIKNPALNRMKTNGSPCLSLLFKPGLLSTLLCIISYLSTVSGRMWHNAIVKSIPAAKQLQKERKFYLQKDNFWFPF